MRSKVIHIIFILFTFFVAAQVNAFNIERVCLDKNNDVSVFWYAAFDSCDAFIAYEIWGRENDISPFKLINKVIDYSQTNVIIFNAGSISNQWQYFLKAYYICGVTMDSLTTDTLTIDRSPPENVQIDTVSVKDNKVFIGWKSSISEDTKGYLVYYVDANNVNNILDTVYGKENTSYYDLGARNPSERGIQYRIVAFDSCENLAAISFGHTTMFLTHTHDSCTRKVTMSWSPYANWIAGNREYDIVLKEDGGSEAVLESIGGDGNSYALINLKNHTNYCVYVRCRNTTNNMTTSSNISCFRTEFIVPPGYIYLNNVSVDEREIHISWMIEKKASIKEFALYKSDDNESYRLLNNIIYTGNLSYEYADNTVNIDEMRYFYKIGLYDNCDKEVEISNMGSSILLSKEKKDSDYFLNWTAYENWHQGTESHQIMSIDMDAGIWEDEELVDGSTLRLGSGLKEKEIKGYEKCYYVVAEEIYSDLYDTKEKSRSNIVCITGDLIGYFPSAIAPKSIIDSNRVLFPVGKLIDYDASRMDVYNRWGEKFWSSSSSQIFWEGKQENGREAPTGVYYYIAVLKGKNGKEFKYSGTVHLIR